jgi:hypothetical protein
MLAENPAVFCQHFVFAGIICVLSEAFVHFAVK